MAWGTSPKWPILCGVGCKTTVNEATWKTDVKMWGGLVVGCQERRLVCEKNWLQNTPMASYIVCLVSTPPSFAASVTQSRLLRAVWCWGHPTTVNSMSPAWSFHVAVPTVWNNNLLRHLHWWHYLQPVRSLTEDVCAGLLVRNWQCITTMRKSDFSICHFDWYSFNSKSCQYAAVHTTKYQ